MVIALGFYTEADFSSTLTVTAVGRDPQGDVILRFEIEEGTSVEMTKWHFTQLIAEIHERLQRL